MQTDFFTRNHDYLRPAIVRTGSVNEPTGLFSSIYFSFMGQRKRKETDTFAGFTGILTVKWYSPTYLVAGMKSKKACILA